MWRNRLVPAGMPPATQSPADEPAVALAVRGPQTEVTPPMRDALALALHHRWHGDHHEGRRGSEVECARLAGAFDDVAAIEPLPHHLAPHRKDHSMSDTYWQFPTGVGGVYRDDAMSEDARKLAHRVVVINPDDAERVERLAHAVGEACDYSATHSPARLADALREFANPTPPKPDEPTGLGAVVEDLDGKQWVRSNTGEYPWSDQPDPADEDETWEARYYRDITAIRVLSEGVA